MKLLVSKIILLVSLVTFVGSSCKKDKETSSGSPEELKKEILSNIAQNVCKASYEDMYAKSTLLLEAAQALNANSNQANLDKCRLLWKEVRNTWEQTESWLFGPISANDIDPRIDTWPVDFTALDNVLESDHTLNEAYISGLEESLKGFHPVEYILWGQNGNKTADSVTPRQKEYLIGLAQNLNKLCKEVRDTWADGYSDQLANAGNGSTEFVTKEAAFVQLVDAMSGICEEVANGKIKDPFNAQNPLLEESPFSKNSITDFTNNVRGVMDVYQGRFITDGKGLEDLVRTYNISLDSEIKTKHAAAIAALNAIDKPFGEAITADPNKVQNVMDKINELGLVLDTKLKPFLQQYGK